MNDALGRFLASQYFQASIWSVLARRFVRTTDKRLYKYSPDTKLMLQVPSRPHYAWCMMKAADLASRLGHDRVSTIEFGVAGGNGLTFMCEWAREVKRATGVTVECYGFDTGSGMPPPEGHRDLPYWFQEAQYSMDVDALRARVPQANLILGDIAGTVHSFVETYDPAPIGAIFNDTDYWSSTRESFRLYEAAQDRPHNFLPRQFLYFDDIVGTELEMYGPCNGQLLAIDEFNSQQSRVAIHLNHNLLTKVHLPWRRQIYYAHIFEHPDYARFIGADRQEEMEQALKLR